MHELSLAQNIIEIITGELLENGLTKVDTITLKIGEMAQVLPDSLRFGFECLIRETPLEGVKLIIEIVPAKGRCMSCGKNFIIENREFICPECGKAGIEVLTGKELEIVELEGT
ncbi:MAG: hydrogenase maturation nickel metallochaperone HypA [Deltaproteobacteria bacterium]|nr:hydrogenase maturation nickel metallochaperone HypA [Deltaproteobacteria bacterium]MBW1960030.1 hydrogenase maturation nickel metallochaperone HypA [Deltaproteobacteria bacterium]